MDTLKGYLSDLPLRQLKTYIQSGNLVFTASASARSVNTDIAQALVKQNLSVTALTFDAQKMQNILDGVPYERWGLTTETNPSRLHLFFLCKPLEPTVFEAWAALKTSREHIFQTEQVLYLFAPDGIGRSKLVQQIDKKLGVPVTARNVRTIQKLTDMALALV